MRVLLIALALAACGSDDTVVEPGDPHAAAACDSHWVNNGYTDCEAACVDSVKALNASGPACDAQTSAGPVSCVKTFEFAGATGCCATQTKPNVRFGECN